MAVPRPGPPFAARGPFAPFDRPAVRALHGDGRWYPGRLHGWVSKADAWWAVVTYSTSPGIRFYVCVPAGSVRPDDDVRDLG